MKLSNQCCTMEQGRKLKGLGISGNHFIHMILPETRYRQAGQIIVPAGTRNHFMDPGEEAPAFTVAELLQMLPEEINGGALTIEKEVAFINEDMDTEEACTIGYKKEAVWLIGHGLYNLADSAASCLIYLLEARLLIAEEANNRLINS